MKQFLKDINPFNKMWKLIAANILLGFVIMTFFYNGWNNSLIHFTLSFVWSFAICFTQWVGHNYINAKLNEHFSWSNNPIKRTLYGALYGILYAVVAYLVVQLIMYRIVNGEFPENPVQWILESSIYVIIIALLITLVFTTIGFFKAWKKTLIEAEKFKAEMLLYKYEALQNQINPHFLFNSFNVLTDLVYQDQKMAVKFIKQLSELFRYVLDSRDKELVPLSAELEFIRSFAYLLQTRFEDKLHFEISVSSTGDEMIVPMSLQLLVENCVKHNEISGAKPLTIKIEQKDNYIQVSNNLQIKNVGTHSKKMGLANIVQQYRFFTDTELKIENNNECFTVSVPLIKVSE